MDTKQLVQFLQSSTFKKIYSVIFLLLLILGFYIIVKPGPFLKYGYGGIFIFNLLGVLGLI